MLYTEQNVKDNIRSRDGKRVFYLGKADTLTPGARDWLTQARIAILPASQAKPQAYRLLDGGIMAEKPEHMTHLHGEVLVSKAHPRIAFRGAVDSLEAELILCQLAVPDRKQELQEILKLTRELIRCEVLEEPLEEVTLCGLTPQQIRQHSHRPQDFYSQPHFMPEASDGWEIARLNRCRCAARSAELMAVRAFLDADGVPSREDILRAMNRISSMLYILMIRLKKEST